MDKHNIIGVFTLCIIIMGIVCFSVGLNDAYNDFYKRPKALDVYRGKTTLEITYRDSVAVDSVVVYKKLDYGK